MTKSIFLNHLSTLTKPIKARELAEEFNLAVTTARTWAMTNGYVVLVAIYILKAQAVIQ
ncbi:MAG: hypothetical protein ACRC80_01310 [Waterburya sp.]